MSQMTDSFANVKKVLSQLPGKLQDNVLVGATRAAAKVIAIDARANVPVDTGLLKKSIGIARAKKGDTKNGHIKFYVVPKSKVMTTAKGTLGDGTKVKLKIKQYAWYAHMVEFGTSKMAARPFLRPAYANSAVKSVKAFQEYALKRVDKEVEKLAKR